MKALDFDYVVPGAGKVMSRAEAQTATNHHIQQLDNVDDIVLKLIKEPVSTEDLVTLLSQELSLSSSISQIDETTTPGMPSISPSKLRPRRKPTIATFTLSFVIQSSSSIFKSFLYM
jgi:hypothetical protein